MKLSKIARCIRMVGTSSHLSWQLMLSAAAFSAGIPATMAATIDYDGTAASATLQPNPADPTGSMGNDELYPGTPVLPIASHNTVNVNYDPTVGTPNNPSIVMGGYVQDGVAEDNNVNMSNGNVGEIHGAMGYADSADADVTVQNNHVTINGGTASSEGAIGGSLSPISATTSDGSGKGTANINNNTVTINGGNISAATGGEVDNADNAKVSDNHVIINSGATTTGGTVIGGTSATMNTGSVTNNDVTVNGTVAGTVIGGQGTNYNTAGGQVTLSGNHVDIDNGTVNKFTDPTNSDINGDVYGAVGEGDHATATNNNVNISGNSTIDNSVYGSSVEGDHATATNNNVNISGNSTVSMNGSGNGIYGSSVAGDHATASQNSVTVSNTSTTGTIGTIYGSSLESGDHVTASNNHVTIDNNSTVRGTIYGVQAGGLGSSTVSNASVTDNTVTSSGNVKDVLGVAVNSTGDVDVSRNTVSINGGTVQQVYGVWLPNANNATINDNKVIITDSDIQNTVTGVLSANSGKATANNNQVVISGGNFTTTSHHLITGVHIDNDQSNTASNNRVDISGVGGVISAVEGVTAEAGSNLNPTSNTTVENNNVSIKGSTVRSTAIAATGSTNLGTPIVRGNHIDIIDSNIGTRVSAGEAGGKNALLTNNSVSISGNSTIGGDVYAAWAQESHRYGKDGGMAINNTVSLSGEHTTIGGTVYGGRISDHSYPTPDPDVTDFNRTTAGNTLNLNRYRGSVGGVKNFENYNWTLPANVHNGDTLMTITGTDAVDLTHTKQHIADMQMSDNRLNVGDTITLIDKTQSNTWNTAGYQIHQGQFIVYNAALTQDANSGGADDSLNLKILGGGVGGSAAHLNPQTKAYAEGREAALGLVNQGQDLMAGGGIDQVRNLVKADQAQANRPSITPFIIAGGSSQRYKTGSHVNVDSLNVAAGVAGGLNFGSNNKATLGAFFEYGKGDYDTYNSFTNYAHVHGDGDSHYSGGGVFGRMDLASNAYVEASLHAGSSRTKFNIDAKEGVLNGYGSSYRSRSPYFGGHIGGGYVFNFDDKQSLDTYARYLWTHMKDDKVRVSGEPLRFDSTDSQRIQLGGRYTYAVNDHFKPYAGVAYEYEFDGKAKAKAYEFNLDRPELKGSTGIFEAGFHVQPSANNDGLSIDVTGQGFVGKRQGGGGNVKVKYQF